MAMTYTGADGLFTQLGKMLKYRNTYLTLGLTTLASDLSAIRTILTAGNAGNRDELLANFTSMYGQDEGSGGIRSQVTAGWRASVSRLMELRMLDYDTVLTQLGITGRDLQQVLYRLIDQMVLDTATVDKTTFTLGAVSAATGNSGVGTVSTSKILDGTTSPGVGMMPHRRYKDLNSELCTPDTYTLLCVSDSQGTGGGRTAEGAEVFRWYGSPAYNKESWETEGAGEGPSVTVATGNQHNILMNRDFEITGGNTTTGQFPNWVVDAGTPGTHTVIESSVTTSSATSNVYRGLKALRFDSTGTPPASIQVSQVVPVSRLKARTCYHFGIWYKASAAVVAGDLTIQFEGTGYSAGGTEKISVAAASLATTWTYKEFWVNMPDQIPADGTFKLVIKWTGTPTASKQIWFDAISFRQPDWFAGHALVIGSSFWATPWKVGDRLTYAITGTDKVFQKWFRQIQGVQLPSDASPSIVDSLAT